ncbi:winged helix-turn-helix domain-containing protein [Parasulfitobacter algicola]|uniref:LysR family transcriptional regulator n=1 Tax=Parasulfitobacter algicola TaxID=2614809 RepID=A0ABX2ITW9_9RHOB|nr:LysR family transcriptional regulator [Sulfitobacter algicola]NSX56344.1 LysR family transcriptional regulator [Sulfitobacter algicola]
MPDPHKQLRLRIVFGDSGMIGPGKVDLLQHIEKKGSISAAGREMGMSYKRAWMLVETMNALFSAPVVESSRGGAKGGGARLTDLGHQVIAHYIALHQKAWSAAQDDIHALEDLCAKGAHD